MREDLIKYFHDMTEDYCDDDAGTPSEGPGYYAMVWGGLYPVSQEEISKYGLTSEDANLIYGSNGCITHVAKDGKREATLYSTLEEVRDAWDVVLNIVSEYENG